MKRLLLILLLLATPASAVNFFASDGDIALLLQFDSTATLGLNAAHSLDGTVSDVDLNTTLEQEGVGCADFDDAFGGSITITHANQPTKLLDGSDFTICGWFRLGTVNAKTLFSQGTEGSDLSVKLEVHDAGATESFQVVIGYGDGSSSDTYTHASDLNASSWYWVGVTCDTDGNVRIRVYRDGVGALGTDIYTSTLHTYASNSEDVVIGSHMDGFMDELAVFDRALDVGELDAVRAGTFNSGAAPFSYYCSPTGDNDRLGTSALPWGPVSDIVGDRKLGRYVNEGDTVYLQDGYHGHFSVSSATSTEKQFTDYITFASASGAQPTLSGIHQGGGVYLKWDGSGATSGYIKVSPEYAGTVTATNPGSRPTIIYTGSSTGAEYQYFTGIDVFTVNDASVWDAADWTEISRLGFRCYVNHLTITDCLIRNVQAGVTGPYHDFTFTNNTISGFSDNAIETGGYTNQTITNNSILDCYSFSEATLTSWGAGDFHPDCIQISGSGDATNLNVSYNYINTAVDPTRSQKGWAQGLFLTSDIWTGVVQNNVIMCQNAANACTFGYGATGSDPDGRDVQDLLIANNTIVCPQGYGGDLYIRFQGNEVGTRVNIDIVNNFYHNAHVDSASSSFTYLGNMDSDDYTLTDQFVSYATGDVDLKAGSALINQGTTLHDAPTDDIDETARDATPDVGAYEYGGAAPEDPPGAASLPSPSDDATGVAVAPTLSWTVDGYTDDCDVYFGTTSGSLASIGNQEALTYSPGTLNYSIEYFWRIDANNAYGTTTGSEWSFTVTSEPATPTTNNFADDANCVALWRLETGYLTTDSIGDNTLSNVGVVSESVAHKDGISSGDWERDDSDYMSITDTSLDAGFPLKSGVADGTFSCCYWVYWESFTDVENSQTLSKYYSAGDARSFTLSHTDGGVCRVLLGKSSGENRDAYVYDGAGEAMVTGRWYHFAFTYQQSNKSCRVRCWDATAGALSIDDTFTADNTMSLTTAPLMLGVIYGTGLGYFDGLLDEVVIFDDVLTAAEIDEIRLGTYLVEEAAETTQAHGAVIVSFQ